MDEIRPFFSVGAGHERAWIAIFMSGSGSNAEVLLQKAADKTAAFEVKLLFTDAPESSRTLELGEKFQIPVLSLDIRKFYADHGECDIRLNSDYRRQLRDEWSECVRQMIEPYKCDFVVFAGFLPLTNLAEKIVCLNVHPGDLTVEDADGSRRYAGLHCEPVERCILDGCDKMRSSVILVQKYSGNGKKDVDGGPVLGVSAPVAIDRHGMSVDSLRCIQSARTTAPYRDDLRKLALENIETLKYSGDHVVFPQTVDAFAAGKYGRNDHNQLCFKDDDGKWQIVKTVEYSANGDPVIQLQPEIVMKKSRNKMVRYCKYLYAKIVRESGTPGYIARGWALGMFIGCVMPVFCQLVVSIPLSFVLRCSKVGAALGTFITTPPTAIFIYPVQIWLGNKFINGNLSSDAARNLLALFNDSEIRFAEKWSKFVEMGGELVAAFFVGGLLWAAVMTPLTYFGVRTLVVRYRKMRDARRAAQKRGAEK